MDNDQALDLLKKAVVRLKLINGGDSNCIHENADLCANHKLIHDIEKFLNVQELGCDDEKIKENTCQGRNQN